MLKVSWWGLPKLIPLGLVLSGGVRYLRVQELGSGAKSNGDFLFLCLVVGLTFCSSCPPTCALPQTPITGCGVRWVVVLGIGHMQSGGCCVDKERKRCFDFVILFHCPPRDSALPIPHALDRGWISLLGGGEIGGGGVGLCGGNGKGVISAPLIFRIQDVPSWAPPRCGRWVHHYTP